MEKPKIVIIDDEEMICSILSQELHAILSDKFQVLSFIDSEVGYRAIIDLNPVMVLTDLIMPEVTGEQIKALCDDMVIMCLIVTGYECKQAHLTKPIDMKLLVSEIDKAINIDQLETNDLELKVFGEYLSDKLANLTVKIHQP